jgi:outer membrane protein insertion porin family
MGLERPHIRRLLLAAALWTACLLAGSSRAEAPAPTLGESLPELRPAAGLASGLVGLPIRRIQIVTIGDRWIGRAELRRVRLGDVLSGEVARRGMQELLDSGRYADVRAEAVRQEDGVLLRLVVTPRRVVARTKISGGTLDDEETLHAAALNAGDELTAATLAERGESVRKLYVRRGFPRAAVVADAVDTDDPMRVIVTFRIDPGPPRLVRRRVFRVYPPPSPELVALLDDYDVSAGDRADEDDAARADHEQEDALRRSGWHAAQVTHRFDGPDGPGSLTVDVQVGPLVQVKVEGNHRFDEGELLGALELEDNDDRSPSTLASRIEKYYVERGFLDVRVTPELRGGPSDTTNVLVLRVKESEVVRVVAREYPCLAGARSADDVGAEIDSFLSEALPGTSFAGPVDPATIDATFGPRNTTGARVPPVESNPWRTYVADVYERATKHLQELYRSEGYLSAVVGPVVPMRRACDRRSPAGECVPVGERARPQVTCPKTDTELPSADPAPPPQCVPDPRRGVRCESDIVLHIPIKLGPRAVLWDTLFEGNAVLVEAELARIAELPLGAPVSQLELEKARRRLLDEYAERGFAFATVEERTELSADRTRARARFVINEREQVRVRDIVVRGAHHTNESLILGRVAFGPGDVYRRSDVRSTEERLATLGVFSRVSVGLEDPEVFAKEKVVVITVRERASQYLDVRPGFSTGDGFRAMFEYGHRNIAERAIRLTVHVELGFLPDFLIFDKEVRARFDALSLRDRLERRNSISVELPEIGLGPLFPLGVSLLDVRDNTRDFGLTKEAAIGTLSYRPSARFVTQIGGSLELNNALIFAGGDINSYLEANPGQAARLRVPDGKTTAVAERVNATWDRRDNPFDATQGTFATGSVEHVHASPTDESLDPVTGQPRPTSDFLRLTTRVAGYVRLSDRGLALALSFRWGYNVQLKADSQTYPDRLFFFGGVDSIRGFLQDSVIPEDLAQKIIADEQRAAQPGANPDEVYFTPAQVPIRGGNVLLNPRAELRIPLVGVIQTALFLDSGNLWLDPATVNPTKLRYAAGTGLRAATPVGPLALDIGMNLDRRSWEDPFAFHFSIGLF